MVATREVVVWVAAVLVVLFLLAVVAVTLEVAAATVVSAMAVVMALVVVAIPGGCGDGIGSICFALSTVEMVSV